MEKKNGKSITFGEKKTTFNLEEDPFSGYDINVKKIK